MKKKNFTYKTGIIICIFLYVLFIIGVILYIPHSNIPTRKSVVADSNSSDGKISDEEGSFKRKNFWNIYYGKSFNDVKATAPRFKHIEDELYQLDTGFLDEEDYSFRTDVFGVFEKGYLTHLFFTTSGLPDLCGIKNYKINDEDFESVNLVAVADMIYMGVMTADDITSGAFSADSCTISDDLESEICRTPSGATCIYELCPGSRLTVMCE